MWLDWMISCDLTLLAQTSQDVIRALKFLGVVAVVVVTLGVVGVCTMVALFVGYRRNKQVNRF